MSKIVEALKNMKEVEAPQWSHFVKTGASKQLPPKQEDWWYIRTASILNKVNKFGPIGTNKLSRAYGDRKNRGLRPDTKCSASRKVIRVALQQLESAGLIKQVDTPKSGKVMTKEGVEFLKKHKE